MVKNPVPRKKPLFVLMKSRVLLMKRLSVLLFSLMITRSGRKKLHVWRRFSIVLPKLRFKVHGVALSNVRVRVGYSW